LTDSAEQNRGRELFVKIISEKGRISHWVSEANKKIRNHSNRENALYRQGEDYVQDAILKILSLEIIPERGADEVDKFVTGFIRHEISYELRQARKKVPISKWRDRGDDNDEKEFVPAMRRHLIQDWNENERNLGNMREDFDDPFERKAVEVDPAEIMKRCLQLMEKKPAVWKTVFEERAKGHQNKVIAKYLCVEVAEVEKMWKRIVRYLRKNIPDTGNIFFLEEEGEVRKAS
jgi:DNA-directed RNA polymerase specialized sigma24 family protein